MSQLIPPGIDPPGFLSQTDCERIFNTLAKAATGGGETRIRIVSHWSGNLRWARNRVSSSGDTRDNLVYVTRSLNKSYGQYSVNQIDDASLQSAVKYTEWLMRYLPEGDTVPNYEYDAPHANPPIWFDDTYRLNATVRNDVAQPLMDMAESAGLLSAGYLQVSAGGHAVITSTGLRRYYPYTTAQCSITVRDPHGKGSGWAGVDYSDWNRIDAKALAATALDKCVKSLNPVRLEPGRYTAILEPQAVAALLEMVMFHIIRIHNEQIPDYPFWKSQDTSRIGDKIIDERLTVTADVMDPDLGWVPFDPRGEPFLPATWIENGVLRNLYYDHAYAVRRLGANEPLLSNGACRMSGGTTSIDEMIATTKRGLLVTRFDQLARVDLRSLLYTGYTRDGLWLIENGKIQKPVKNFRFTESPWFVFNNVIQLGVPQRVFNPEAPMVVPPLKVNDFSFTSLSDAI